MKIAAPRPAVTFTASQEEAGALLLHLHAEGLCGVADGLVRPRITVAGISQEDLNSRVHAWQRRCFEERRAAEARGGRRMIPDDLSRHYHRLAHTAALVGDYADHPERQKELLAWALEAVRAIARARGLQIEPRQPEPIPHRISRELWPAQGGRVEEDAVAEGAAPSPPPAPERARSSWSGVVGCEE